MVFIIWFISCYMFKQKDLIIVHYSKQLVVANESKYLSIGKVIRGFLITHFNIIQMGRSGKRMNRNCVDGNFYFIFFLFLRAEYFILTLWFSASEYNCD